MGGKKMETSVKKMPEMNLFDHIMAIKNTSNTYPSLFFFLRESEADSV